MATEFTYTATEASGGGAGGSSMTGPVFDYVIGYEDRDDLHTSRWALAGVNTTSGGNTDRGWLWMAAVRSGSTVTVDLYKDAGCDSDDKVATGTADVTDIDGAPARCALAAANSSGLTGELYLEDYDGDPAAPVPVLAALCVDSDLAEEYHNLDDLPGDVYDSTNGMARHCAAATRNVLLLVSQTYAEELGGYGAPEHRHSAAASRAWPDFRRIANPDQLKSAAVHWALMLAFGSCHERAQDTMYSRLRDYHDAKRKEAIAAWHLAFNVDPDSDEDADRSKSSGMARVTRL